ncbi:MAG: hypothetical protein N2444_09765, partial [Methylocystis sp.]|nr:hypothetical protein [Methylocystis sp.]
MPYFMVENFKAGLDVRKSALTSPAGTLLRLENAAISPGGEIKKRKAFVKVATLTGTFGLAAIGNTVVAFTRNQDITAPALGAPDVTLRYDKLPNQSPTAVQTDYDVYDGKLYVVLFDQTPSPPPAYASGSVLPTGVPEGSVFKRTSDNTRWIWLNDIWRTWAEDANGAALPATIAPSEGDTFQNTTDGKIYIYKFGAWTVLKAKFTGASFPVQGSGGSMGAYSGYTSIAEGDIFYNTGNSKYYKFLSGAWVELVIT